MDSDCCNISHRFHIPDFPEQLFLGKHSVRILCKEGKQIIFLGSKCFLLSVYPYAACSLINLDPADLHNIIFAYIGTDQTIISVHMCLDSGYQFTWTEWFCHVIICPQSQTSDFIYVIFLCRYHDDRSIFFLSYLPADIKAIHFRKHQIQNNQVKLLIQRTRQSGVSSVADFNFKSGKLQIILLQICNCLFIFYN